jgi:hypothetical protein
MTTERSRDTVGSPLARGVSLVVLGAAAVVLVIGLGLSVTYLVTHSSPPCSNPPQRNSNPPQLAVVGLCLLAFVIGHATARWQAIDPSHLHRHRSENRPAPERDTRKKTALIVQGLLLLFLVEIFGLLVIEMSTLSRGVWPITYYVRCAYDAAGWPATYTAMAILFLVGRWFWLPRGGKGAPTGT